MKIYDIQIEACEKKYLRIPEKLEKLLIRWKISDTSIICEKRICCSVAQIMMIAVLPHYQKKSFSQTFHLLQCILYTCYHHK